MNAEIPKLRLRGTVSPPAGLRAEAIQKLGDDRYRDLVREHGADFTREQMERFTWR